MSDEPYTSLLEETLEAWEHVRKGVLEEAENIPDDRYDFRPADESRSVSTLLLHIVGSGLVMTGELGREDGDFTRQSYPEHMEEHAGHLPEEPSPGELRELLTLTYAEGAARLRATGDLRMLQMIRRFDGTPGTRLAWLNHGIAHEMYHRGQLALCARLMGHVPALTQRIRGG